MEGGTGLQGVSSNLNLNFSFAQQTGSFGEPGRPNYQIVAVPMVTVGPGRRKVGATMDHNYQIAELILDHNYQLVE